MSIWLILLIVVLIIAMSGTAPTWPHSQGWGWYPSSTLAVILVIIIILILLGRL